MEESLDPTRLKYFMQVLNSGSVRGAAEVLERDPSALSRAVGVLEKDCGTALLERRGRGVVPTDAGELLADYLRRQESQKQHLLAQMEAIRKVERGHIDIATGEGYVPWLIHHSLQTFMRTHPAITVSLEVCNSADIVSRVVDERADIGLLFQPPNDERIRSHHSHTQPIQALVLKAHPLTRLARPLELADLLPYPGATVTGRFGVRQHVEATEVSEGVKLTSLLTTNSFSALDDFVMAGLGYALRPRMPPPMHLNIPEVIALPMKNPLLNQGRSHVISRHGRMLPPAVVELLRQIVGDIANLKDVEAGK